MYLSSNNRNVHPAVIDVLQRDISGQIKNHLSYVSVVVMFVEKTSYNSNKEL